MDELQQREKEIRERLEELKIRKDSIAYQVEEAMMIAKERNEWADGEWLSRARHAMRIVGREMSKLQAELGEINKAKKQENIRISEERSRLFERQFMYNAKSILPAILYEQILNKTLEQITSMVEEK